VVLTLWIFGKLAHTIRLFVKKNCFVSDYIYTPTTSNITSYKRDICLSILCTKDHQSGNEDQSDDNGGNDYSQRRDGRVYRHPPYQGARKPNKEAREVAHHPILSKGSSIPSLFCFISVFCFEIKKKIKHFLFETGKASSFLE
jgi:hypothetical protein